MTAEELKQLGYKPKLCKIGTLYFKGNFFCSIDSDGVVDLRSSDDDMSTLAKVTTPQELKQQEAKYYRDMANHYKTMAEAYETLADIYEKSL